MHDTYFSQFKHVFESALTQALGKIIEIFPQVVVAILLLILGWLVASLVRFLLLKALFFFAVDKLAAKTPLEKMLKNVGLRKSVSEILGSLFFWLIIFFTLVFASDVLRLTQVANALSVVTGYIPKVIAAFLIVIFGMLLAKFLQTFVTQAIGRTDIGYERTIGKIVNVIAISFVLIAALEQLQMRLSVVTTNFMIILVSALFITGAAVVVGSRGLLENFMASKNLKSSLRHGDKIRILEYSGTVKEITHTSVVLQSDHTHIVLPAKIFFEHTYTRHS